jgi:hypothetical protein
MELCLPFKLHKAQREIFRDKHRFRVTVNGRRFGKTTLGQTEMVVRSLSCPHKVSPQFPLSVLGILPTAKQARNILWKPLVGLVESTALGNVVQKVNNTYMEMIFNNGIQLLIGGANDSGGDRMRGLKVYFALCDETQDIKPIVWNEVIRPAMSDTPGSSALFTGTPKGKQNFLYELFCRPEHDGQWASFSYPSSANPIIPRQEIETARLTMPPRLFAQEYEASFVDFPGKFYTELDSENYHFGALPPFDLVVMGVDWGDLHPALVVLGRSNRQWYFLEGWSPNNTKSPEPIPSALFRQQVKRLRHKWNIQAAFCDPSRPSEILALRDLVPKSVAGYNPIMEGITQVHSLIHNNNLLFPQELKADPVQGAVDPELAFSLLSSYHREQDSWGNYKDVPADGYFSHTCDALRYALTIPVGQKT